jgi:hypothetical protein
MSEEFSVGKDVKALCGKCKLALYHTITLMNGDNIKKVQCNTCKGTHAFKDPALAIIKKKRTVRKKTGPAIPLSELWEKALKATSVEEQKYSIRGSFALEDVIAHSKFGVGIVQAVVDNDKIEVMFQNDIKVLVHNK